jgi:ubiquinol-cytochrome c reductase iron-sulfur subunit
MGKARSETAANNIEGTVGAREAETSSVRRRDFLNIAPIAFAGTGAALAAWPLIDSLNPSADVLAQATVEVDLRPIEIGQRVTVNWRKQPLFIIRRSADAIARARADDNADLIDPETDAARTQRPEWLVVIGVCTHLGCIPLGQNPGDNRGRFGGWFCPCHGSIYDASGRERKGPAPKNLIVPPYRFVGGNRLVVG